MHLFCVVLEHAMMIWIIFLILAILLFEYFNLFLYKPIVRAKLYFELYKQNKTIVLIYTLPNRVSYFFLIISTYLKRLSFLHHILVGNGKHCTQHILKLFQPFKRLQSEKCSGQQCFPFLTVRVQKETFLSNQQMHLT